LLGDGWVGGGGVGGRKRNARERDANCNGEKTSHSRIWGTERFRIERNKACSPNRKRKKIKRE